MAGSKRMLYGIRMAAVLLLAMSVSACTSQDQNNTQYKSQQNGKSQKMASNGGKEGKVTAKSSGGAGGKEENRIGKLEVDEQEARIPTKIVQGRLLVPLDELVKVIGYQMTMSDDHKEIWIGAIDPIYKLTLGSNKAEREGEPIELSEAPVVVDEKVYLPESSLIDLFQRDIRYLADGGEHLKLNAITTDAVSLDKIEDGEAPDGKSFFNDDPNDPFKGPLTGTGVESSTGTPQSGFQALALRNIDVNALINTAMRYRGTPYKFGAAPYPQSKRFDCSSFTQYVFGKYGVKLRRVSRDQATQGTFVSRSNLRKGDLVFFSVPGRFTSDNIVGHVGIYLGGGKMIHTYSTASGGVHVSSINSGYWPKKFLRARRFVY